MKKLVIDRNKWYRGKNGVGSRLLRNDGAMCCLGFYSISCGLEKQEILGVSFPTDLKGPLAGRYQKNKAVSFPEEMRWLDTPLLEREISGTNDSTSIKDDYREAQLIRLFADNGVAVEFIN